MSLLGGSSDSIHCPHCGASMRRGMLRCRECGGAKEDDFQLADEVQASAYVPRCDKCGSPLGDDGGDCARCASAMLDELLSSAPSESALPTGGRRSQQLDALQASPAGASRLRPDAFRPSEGRTAQPRENEKSELRKGRQRRSSSDDDIPVKRKSKAARAGRRDSDDDVMDYLAAPAEPDSERESSFSSFVEAETTPDAAPMSTSDAASQASAALTLSLASTDANLRCQAATALGQLGVAEAMSALEPLMADPEISVRRAVAESLIQLGHPKGEALRSIAERKPAVAKEPPRPRTPKPRRNWSLPRFSFDFDHETLTQTGGPVIGVVVLVLGVFLWHSGILFGPRLDESYRPIKPFYAFWMADPAATAPPAVSPKTAGADGPEMNF